MPRLGFLRLAVAVLVIAVFSFSLRVALAFQSEVLDSVVSVLPLWPGHAQGGQPQVPPGSSPEGTAVAILPGGYFVTALHVVERATAIALRSPFRYHTTPVFGAGTRTQGDIGIRGSWARGCSSAYSATRGLNLTVSMIPLPVGVAQ